MRNFFRYSLFDLITIEFTIFHWLVKFCVRNFIACRLEIKLSRVKVKAIFSHRICGLWTVNHENLDSFHFKASFLVCKKFSLCFKFVAKRTSDACINPGRTKISCKINSHDNCSLHNRMNNSTCCNCGEIRNHLATNFYLNFVSKRASFMTKVHLKQHRLFHQATSSYATVRSTLIYCQHCTALIHSTFNRYLTNKFYFSGRDFFCLHVNESKIYARLQLKLETVSKIWLWGVA